MSSPRGFLVGGIEGSGIGAPVVALNRVDGRTGGAGVVEGKRREKGKGMKRVYGAEAVRILRCMFIDRNARLACGTYLEPVIV